MIIIIIFSQIIQEIDQSDFQMNVELLFSDSDYGWEKYCPFILTLKKDILISMSILKILSSHKVKLSWTNFLKSRLSLTRFYLILVDLEKLWWYFSLSKWKLINNELMVKIIPCNRLLSFEIIWTRIKWNCWGATDWEMHIIIPLNFYPTLCSDTKLWYSITTQHLLSYWEEKIAC